MILYHTNDVHGRVEALQALLALAQERDSHYIWLDSGDALRGSNTVFHRRERALQLMSSGGCTAMAMGNREFNYLRRVMRWRQAERNFPLLCANLEDLRGYAPTWQAEYTFSTPEGMVALVGATPVQYPVGHFWERVFGFRFLDPLQVVPALAEDANDRGAAVIVLSHLGVEVDKLLAKKLPTGTLILGGHTHTVLCEPLEVNGCWIVQTGAHAQYIGRLEYAVSERSLRNYELINALV